MRSPILTLVRHHVMNRPIRTGLTILGIAIGVSSAMGIRLSNIEVLRAFEDSVRTITGTVTLQISGGRRGFEESVITEVRNSPEVVKAIPIIREPVQVFTKEGKERNAMVWGLDLLDVMDTEDFTVGPNRGMDIPLEDFVSPHTIFLGNTLAADWGVEVGDSVVLGLDERQFEVVVRGLIEPSQEKKMSWGSLALMDIASAQYALGLIGILHRIDVVTQPGVPIEGIMTELSGKLDSSIRISRPSQKNQQVERMIHTFQLNLSTLSMVGILVGGFLVFNTVSYSVVQSRREIGILRALGMSRGQVRLLFLGEAGVMGIFGGVLGTGFGAWLAEYLLLLVSESVSELYTSVMVKGIQTSPGLYVLGGGLGLVVSMVGALGPCLNASRTSPVKALAPGDYEEEHQQHVGRLAWVGAGMFLMAALLSLPDPIHGLPVFGYGSAFCVLLGCTCLGPLAVRMLQPVVATRWMQHRGIIGRIAADHMNRSPGRTSVTLSALMVGVSIMLGVGVMVSSFRETVEIWIDQTLLADLIVVPASWPEDAEGTGIATHLPLSMKDQILGFPGVSAVDAYRQDPGRIDGREAFLVARDLPLHARRSGYLFLAGDSSAILQRAVAENGVLLSEVLATVLKKSVGDAVNLSTPHGDKIFPVVGIFYDYATDGGKIVMDWSLYRTIWSESDPTVLAVYLKAGADSLDIREKLKHELDGGSSVLMISQNELREEILEIFDRTFRVTLSLELIAIIVAFLGIINTLVTSILERQRELATLRAIGASQSQIKGMVMWESMFLGVIGGCLGLVGGLLLALLLIKVINKHSFGWTIQFVLPWMNVVEAMGVALVSALLAGYFPARWAASQPIGKGLRYE